MNFECDSASVLSRHQAASKVRDLDVHSKGLLKIEGLVFGARVPSRSILEARTEPGWRLKSNKLQKNQTTVMTQMVKMEDREHNIICRL